jgi:peptide/nickel transport system substrate-binding protein
MKQKLLALGGVGALTLALAGCGVGGSTNSTAAARAALKPQRGGTAVFALQPQTSPNWFFPLVSLAADTVVNFQTIYMSYKPLLYYNSHDQFDPRHALAESVTWNKSGTVYTPSS